MKKHTLLAYAALPIMGLGLLGVAGTASAQGLGSGMMGARLAPEEVVTRHQEMFQKQADLLGVSVDEVKTAWALGKSMQTLAKEKGISEVTLTAKLEAERKAIISAQLQTLVSKGVITQGQADARMKFVESLPKGGKGMHGRHHHGGFGF